MTKTIKGCDVCGAEFSPSAGIELLVGYDQGNPIITEIPFRGFMRHPSQGHTGLDVCRECIKKAMQAYLEQKE